MRLKLLLSQPNYIKYKTYPAILKEKINICSNCSRNAHSNHVYTILTSSSKKSRPSSKKSKPSSKTVSSSSKKSRPSSKTVTSIQKSQDQVQKP